MGNKARQVLLGLAMAACGAVLGYAIARLGGDVVADAPVWAMVAALVLGPLLAVAVHELGHLTAGVLNGMRPVLYLVGPVQVEWRDGKRTWSLNRSLAVAGGLTVCLPPDGRFRKDAMSRYVAGGPLASLLLAVAAFLAGAALAGSWQAPLYTIGLFSLAIAVVTAAPLPGAITNDGSRLRMIRAGDAGARHWLAVTSLTGLGMTGIRPRDWPEDAVNTAAEPGSGSAADRAAGWLLAAYALRDRGEGAAAAELMARIEAVMDQLPAALRLTFAREAASCALALGGRREVAPELSDSSRPGLLEEGWEVPRLRAHLAAAKGDLEEADGHAGQALKCLRRSRMPGLAAMISEELADLRDGSTR